MKRYFCVWYPDEAQMEEDPNGHWVRFEDIPRPTPPDEVGKVVADLRAIAVLVEDIGGDFLALRIRECADRVLRICGRTEVIQ